MGLFLVSLLNSAENAVMRSEMAALTGWLWPRFWSAFKVVEIVEIVEIVEFVEFLVALIIIFNAHHLRYRSSSFWTIIVILVINHRHPYHHF